ncbi:MAG: chemotaxis protein [Burkholderiales bacterium]|nr:MAG: chemotaxis protein [Burkholderiales bacterium]
MKLPFNQRLLVAFVVPAVLFAAALATAIVSLVSTERQFERYLQKEAALASSVSEMYAQGLQMGQALRNAMLDPENQTAYRNLEAARDAYSAAYDKARSLSAGLSVEPAVSALEALRASQAQAQQQVLDTLKTDRDQAITLLNATETPAWRALRGALLQLRDDMGILTEQTQVRVNAHVNRAQQWSVGLAVLAVMVAASLGLMLRRTLRREIGGDPEVARAALGRIAGGDLTGQIPQAQHPQSLMGALAGMQTSMRELVSQVQQTSGHIETASTEIAVGNQDLSARTEAAASNLQQTAASMEELTSTVRSSAQAAQQANQLAASAADVAARGGRVVGNVVSTMEEINQSSRKISDIIGVIDGIAFQTNILALNAAVEAARAGEQGRGFAVVAGEVRSLAQRSANAAKEIKGLIGTSVEKVEAGSHLVSEAGQTMNEIVGSVQRVSDIIGEITAAAGEQSAGIAQVNTAVTHLDQMTQQNAALVEQSAAAAASMKQQALRLAQVVGTFRVA